MAFDIKSFQERYALANKDMADICQCSLPTIQKWRSGDVPVSGAASQLMRLLDQHADGNPAALRKALTGLNPDADWRVTTSQSTESRGMAFPGENFEHMLDLQRRDKALAQSEARYLSIVRDSPNPACRWQPDTTLTYVNRAYAALFGMDQESILGKKWIKFIPKENRASTAVILADMVRRGEEEISIHETLDAQGNTRFFEWRDIPVKNDVGEVVEWHSIAYEVTELILLRRDKDKAKAIREAFFSLSDKPVALFDQEGSFLQVNALFHAEFMEANSCKGFHDLLGGVAAGKFRRLLKRVRGGDAFCYQFLCEDKKSYLLNGRLISGTGKSATYAAVFDELSEPRSSAVVQVRLRNEVIIDGQTLPLIEDAAVRRRLEEHMDELGKAVNVDRIYFFSFDMSTQLFDNVLEWCAEGVQPHIDDLQRLPMSEYPWWTQKIRNHQWIQFEDTSKLPRSAFREREILVAQDICSIMVAPVVINDEAVGFVGFDHNHTERVWHEQERKHLEGFKREVEGLLAKSTDVRTAS